MKNQADSIKQAFMIYNAGIDNYFINQFDSAIEKFSMAIELYPEFADAYNNRGVSKKREGDYFGALEDYKKISLF